MFGNVRAEDIPNMMYLSASIRIVTNRTASGLSFATIIRQNPNLSDRMLDSFRNTYRLCIGALVLPLLMFAIAADGAHAQISEYVVLMPTPISSGKYAGDYDIKGSMIRGDGFVTWGGISPKSLCEMPVREFSPSAVTDGSGGLLLCYTIEHTDSENLGDRDIVIRRINGEGSDVWENPDTGPVLLLAQSSQFEEHPHIVKTGDGAIVLYEVRYADADHKGDVDIAAIRVKDDGTTVWEGAVWVANTDNNERIAGACSDGAGNILVLVESGKNTKDSTTMNRSLTLHRLAPEGTVGWGGSVGKEIVIAGSAHDERNGVITSDGAGGAYIAYEIFYSSGTRKGDMDIIAQHVTADGSRSWTDPAAPPVVSSNARALERAPSIAADSLGIVVSFELDFQADSATPRSRPLKVVGAQRLDKNGKALWNNGERAQVLLVKNRVVNRPQSFSDNSGGVYVVMEGLDTVTGDRDVFIQKLDAKGDRLWGEKGYGISVFNGPMPEERATAFPDNYGGLVVVAVQPPKYRVASSSPASPDSTIVAQRLNDAGKAVWGDGESNLVVTRCELTEDGPTVVQSR